MILGGDALDRLRRSHVAVFGLGGVGSYVVEALCRAGVGELTLIDGDTVDEELRAIEELFNVSLTFDKADQEELKAFVKDYGKEALVEVIIQKAKGEI